MVDFGESDKMIKVSGEVDKTNSYNYLVVIFCFLFKSLKKFFLE